MLKDLEQHLRAQLPLLEGDWLRKDSGYEKDICRILAMQPSQCRYWDATWHQHRVEFKKGRSIWLDLVRYSEILLGSNEDARRDTICLFFIPNKVKSQIDEIICVETHTLIKAVGLTNPQAEALVQLMKAVPRSLNAQSSLTINDVREIKVFSVQREQSLQP